MKSDQLVAEKRSKSDQRTCKGGKSKEHKREKLVSKIIMPFKEKPDPLENGEDDEGNGANSSAEVSDDQSDDKEIDTEERIRRYHAKKATNFANRKNCWLDYPHQPIGVREDAKCKGRTIKYLGNSQYTVGVASFERTVKNP